MHGNEMLQYLAKDFRSGNPSKESKEFLSWAVADLIPSLLYYVGVCSVFYLFFWWMN